jgi:hypothetical protein
MLHTFSENALDALHLDGVIMGFLPLKVAPSRTAIMPIRSSFLPQVSLTIEAINVKSFFDGYTSCNPKNIFCSRKKKRRGPQGQSIALISKRRYA